MLEFFEKLAADDPQNAEAQRDLSVSYEKLGDVQLPLGEHRPLLLLAEDGVALRSVVPLVDRVAFGALEGSAFHSVPVQRVQRGSC